MKIDIHANSCNSCNSWQKKLQLILYSSYQANGDYPKSVQIEFAKIRELVAKKLSISFLNVLLKIKP